MGKGRAPTSFEYYLMNRNEKRREKGYRPHIVPDFQNRFNIDGHVYYKSGLSGKMIKMK